MENTGFYEVEKYLHDASLKIQDPTFCNISEWLARAIQCEHKPTIGLVAFNLNHEQRFSLLKAQGIEVPARIVEMVEGKPCSLIFDYNDSLTIEDETDESGVSVEVGLPVEYLKDRRIAVCDDIQDFRIWLDLSSEVDAFCLLVNATMAMNQSERTWLKECAMELFPDAVTLSIGKLNLLNSEEEADEIRKIVSDSLMKLGMTDNVIDGDQDAIETIAHTIQCDINSAISIKNRAARNALLWAARMMNEMCQQSAVDSNAICAAIAQLDNQKHSLALAGQLSAESILVNNMTLLKSQASDSIRDYGKQMAQNIRQEIQKTPLEKLETMDDKINGYITGSWTYFIRSVTKKIDTAMQNVTLTITKQMERDAGNLISTLDEPARRAVYDAIGLQENNEQLQSSLWKTHPQLRTGSVNIGEMTDQLRKEMRNMMMLSIPLLFVNPWASAGNLLLAKFIRQKREKEELTQMRADMAEQIDRICNDISEKLVNQVENGFDDATRDGAMNVKKAYSSLIERLDGSLKEMLEKEAARAEFSKYMKDQIQNRIPALMDVLK